MNVLKAVGFAAVLLLVNAGPAQAQKRQFYSKSWQKSGGYYYKSYYHKSSASASSYKYHRVISYPSRPKHLYYYNPYSKKYWGRYDCSAHGYSVLEPADQKEKIGDLKEESFPKPGPMPKIPESDDNIAMLPPQEKLPPADGGNGGDGGDGGGNGGAAIPPDESKEVPKKNIQEATGLPEDKLPRQCCSGWVKEESYYYRCSYYQPVSGGNYKSHRVIYYPSKPQYVYYYNPYSGKYWGRYDLKAKGYSMLKDADKREKLSDIPESAFPKPGEMPPIPDSTDNVKLMVPPRDFPTGSDL